LDQGLVPVGIGGGHDLTFAFARPAIARFKITSGVYFDAHTDVRESPGSGMAFRKLVEECGIRKLHLHGAGPFANSAEHLGWFRAHGGLDLAASDSLSASYQPPRADLFVSVDLDVIDAAHAPGVSALNPAGWHPRDVERLVQRLGQESRVRCFDIMELNPAHDEGGRTARVAAHLFLSFLRGFAERKGEA
jgi:arginase family enzyme